MIDLPILVYWAVFCASVSPFPNLLVQSDTLSRSIFVFISDLDCFDFVLIRFRTWQGWLREPTQSSFFTCFVFWRCGCCLDRGWTVRSFACLFFFFLVCARDSIAAWPRSSSTVHSFFFRAPTCIQKTQGLVDIINKLEITYSLLYLSLGVNM